MRLMVCALVVAGAACSRPQVAPTSHKCLWEAVQVPTSLDLGAICFVDARTGWIAAKRQDVVIRTEDGGATWKVQRETEARHVAADLHFSDGRNGSFLRYRDGCFQLGGAIEFTTSDGGETWNERPYDQVRAHREYGRFSHVAGKTWGGGPPLYGVYIEREGEAGGHVPELADFPEGWYSDVCFVDDLHGWLAGYFNIAGSRDGLLLKTDDAGRSWTRFGEQALRGIGKVEQVWFADRLHGWILASDGYATGGIRSRILGTRDAGVTWAVEHESPTWINKLCFIDADHAFAIGHDGLMLRRRAE